MTDDTFPWPAVLRRSTRRPGWWPPSRRDC